MYSSCEGIIHSTFRQTRKKVLYSLKKVKCDKTKCNLKKCVWKYRVKYVCYMHLAFIQYMIGSDNGSGGCGRSNIRCAPRTRRQEIIRIGFVIRSDQLRFLFYCRERRRSSNTTIKGAFHINNKSVC